MAALEVSWVCLYVCYHGEDGSRGHVFAESSVERHVLQVQVVLLHVVLRGLKTPNTGSYTFIGESVTGWPRPNDGTSIKNELCVLFSQAWKQQHWDHKLISWAWGFYPIRALYEHKWWNKPQFFLNLRLHPCFIHTWTAKRRGLEGEGGIRCFIACSSWIHRDDWLHFNNAKHSAPVIASNRTPPVTPCCLARSSLLHRL